MCSREAASFAPGVRSTVVLTQPPKPKWAARVLAATAHNSIGPLFDLIRDRWPTRPVREALFYAVRLRAVRQRQEQQRQASECASNGVPRSEIAIRAENRDFSSRDFAQILGDPKLSRIARACSTWTPRQLDECWFRPRERRFRSSIDKHSTAPVPWMLLESAIGAYDHTQPYDAALENARRERAFRSQLAARAAAPLMRNARRRLRPEMLASELLREEASRAAKRLTRKLLRVRGCSGESVVTPEEALNAIAVLAIDSESRPDRATVHAFGERLDRLTLFPKSKARDAPFLECPAVKFGSIERVIFHSRGLVRRRVKAESGRGGKDGKTERWDRKESWLQGEIDERAASPSDAPLAEAESDAWKIRYFTERVRAIRSSRNPRKRNRERAALDFIRDEFRGSRSSLREFARKRGIPKSNLTRAVSKERQRLKLARKNR